jgi:hypothetical protein
VEFVICIAWKILVQEILEFKVIEMEVSRLSKYLCDGEGGTGL